MLKSLFKKKTEINFRVAGSKHYQESITSIVEDIAKHFDIKKYEGASNNKIIASGKDVWEYPEIHLTKVEFIKELDNEFDPNAIKIEISGRLVGYVPKDYLDYFKDLNKVKKTIATFSGGNYKTLDQDDDEIHDKVIIEKSDKYINLNVTIK